MLIGADHGLPRRKWTCPSDPTIAAYVDGVLGRFGTRWIEFHLSSCQRCRLLVAEVVKAERQTELSQPPVALVQRAIGMAEVRPAPRRWVWVPAAATAATVLFVIAVVTFSFHRPEQLAIRVPAAPSAPLIAKSEPVIMPGAVPDIVRKKRTAELSPTMISPRPDSVVGQRLQFRWNPLSHARDYEVRVASSDGDLVWAGQTEKSTLQLPSHIALRNGWYFAWVTADLADGGTAKSPPVRFLIKR